MGYDEAFVPFAVAAITPLGCAWVASRFVPPTNKWIYSGVVIGTAFLSWKYIVPRMLNSMGYPVPFEAETWTEDNVCLKCNSPFDGCSCERCPQCDEFWNDAWVNCDDCHSCDDCCRESCPHLWEAESFSAEDSGEILTFGRIVWSASCDDEDFQPWEYETEIKSFIRDKNTADGEGSFIIEKDTWDYDENKMTSYNVFVEWTHHYSDFNTAESFSAEGDNQDLLKWVEDYLWDNDKQGYQAYQAHRKSLGLNAESKFVKPYDRRGKIDFRRDNKGRYRRKLSVPLKKNAEWERLTTTLSEISAKRSMASMKGKAHNSPKYLGVKKVDWKVAPYDEVASDEVWGVFRKLS